MDNTHAYFLVAVNRSPIPHFQQILTPCACLVKTYLIIPTYAVPILRMVPDVPFSVFLKTLKEGSFCSAREVCIFSIHKYPIHS